MGRDAEQCAAGHGTSRVERITLGGEWRRYF
jgi:hypothetical protein